MKTTLLFLLLMQSHQVAFAENSIPTYRITSNCIVSIEVKKSEFIPAWEVNVNLNSSAANSLHQFSLENLKTPIRLIDGNNKNITKDHIIIQTPLSTRFQIAGLEVHKEAINVKKSIMSSKGTCGKIIKNDKNT